MCSKMRREGIHQKAGLGEKIPISSSSFMGKKEAIFNGHARSETLGNWILGGWQECKIHATGFTEGRGDKAKEFTVPTGSIIKGLWRNTPEGPVVNIITREAVGAETETHNRFPVVEKE